MKKRTPKSRAMSSKDVFQQLSPQFAQIQALSKKEKQYKKLGYLSFGIIALFIAGYIPFSGVVVQMGQDAFAMLMIPLVYLPFILGAFFMVRSAGSKRKRKVVSAYIVTKMLRTLKPGLQYSKYKCINRSHFERSGIFVPGIHHSAKKSHYSGEDHISGTHNGVVFEASEVRYSHGRMNAFFYLFPPYAYALMLRTGILRPLIKKNVHDFRGLFFMADFHKKFKGRTVVIPDLLEKKMGYLAQKVQQINFKRDELVYLESPEFEKAFTVYSDDQITARYILSPSFMEKILALKQKIKNNVFFSFKDAKIYVAVSASDDLFDFNDKKDRNVKQQAETIVNDIEFCLGLIDNLKLNERIWG